GITPAGGGLNGGGGGTPLSVLPTTQGNQLVIGPGGGVGGGIPPAGGGVGGGIPPAGGGGGGGIPFDQGLALNIDSRASTVGFVAGGVFSSPAPFFASVGFVGGWAGGCYLVEVDEDICA